VEPTAAVAAAALYFHKVPHVEGKTVMTILCGGNAAYPPSK
jgi:threonine dehydratase